MSRARGTIMLHRRLPFRGIFFCIMRNKKALIIVVVVVVVIAGGTLLAGLIGGSSSSGTTTATSSQATDENAASSTVAAFGLTLQQVSIMAPNAADMIANTYAPYVAPALLQQWEADPQSAPGRVVSSPWPDHIQIDSITPQGGGRIRDQR
jgi:hypothetical protein